MQTRVRTASTNRCLALATHTTPFFRFSGICHITRVKFKNIACDLRAVFVVYAMQPGCSAVYMRTTICAQHSTVSFCYPNISKRRMNAHTFLSPFLYLTRYVSFPPFPLALTYLTATNRSVWYPLAVGSLREQSQEERGQEEEEGSQGSGTGSFFCSGTCEKV